MGEMMELMFKYRLLESLIVFGVGAVIMLLSFCYFFIRDKMDRLVDKQAKKRKDKYNE